MTLSALNKAIGIAGNVRSLAIAVGVSSTAAQKWERKGFVPPTSILRVEKALEGKIARYELIDDFFNKQGVTQTETPHGTEATPAAGGGDIIETAAVEGGVAAESSASESAQY